MSATPTSPGGECVLGIDLGTQSVKVAAVGPDATVVASASRPYAVDSPRPGWAESDPAAWLAAVEEACAEVLARVSDPPVAVGLSGQMHGVVLCDDNGEPLRPAITWADARSADEARRLRTELGPDTLARLGSAPFPGFAGVTLAWLSQHEPEILRRARWALQSKDWLRLRLTGEVATDPSDASGTLLYDLVDGAWSDAALTACGVRPELLAPVLASSDDAGPVRSIPALAGVPVAVGGADAACGIHGLDLRVGSGALALGTGAQLSSVIAGADPDTTLRTHTFATVGRIGEAFYRLGAVQSGGLALERVLTWLNADIAEAQRALAAGVRSDDPLFFPFVAGERSPYLDSDLRASWLGLSLSTTREAMLRSVLEGMAYAVSAAYAAIVESGAAPAAPLTVLGGGSRDSAYVALLATALACPLRPSAVADATVLGAARLGAAAIGRAIAPSHDAVVHDIVEPREDPAVADRQWRWRASATASRMPQR